MGPDSAIGRCWAQALQATPHGALRAMDDPTAPNQGARTASAEALLRALPEAGPAYLTAAMDNPSLTDDHVAVIVRSRSAPETLLARIGRDSRWVRSYNVKAGLALNPHTPRPVALNLIKFLLWRDLARVADHPFLAPPLRRLAERILSDRMGEMALGEKIALSRIAGRGLVLRLIEIQEDIVLDALLWNGHMTEQDVTARINDPTTPPGILAVIGRHPRWGGQYGIRVALVRNRRTPLPISLGCLTSLRGRDLEALAEDDETPRLLRLACQRVLADESWQRRRAADEA